MARIGIFIGTVYGNSLAVGEEAQTILEQAGHEVVLFDEPELSQWKDYLTDVALVITSTTGQGDLPDNIRELFAGLRDDIGYQPSLRYGIIALGDSSYDNFAGGGRQFNELLQEQHAQRIGEMLVIDGAEVAAPEEFAQPWLKIWAALVS
ncbi:flavodoxin [Morganella morganii]|uniref:flavodoxin n=1 Tax=Morganella morganii TaxID=582 RepID=UPI000668E7CB|nr:flavodoxin [Morganella morganii]SSN08229.1 flavoprotein YqcA [Klebsiella pneumoniae]EJD6112087.1 flavodoxin [Morganella morganii]EJG2206506.1 flavodoxin [Morganella morganii]EKU4016364.1 flavodoxin [Morganella morganii]ELA7702142.1 flavodoxin [Morganella morganii]